MVEMVLNGAGAQATGLAHAMTEKPAGSFNQQAAVDRAVGRIEASIAPLSKRIKELDKSIAKQERELKSKSQRLDNIEATLDGIFTGKLAISNPRMRDCLTNFKWIEENKARLAAETGDKTELYSALLSEFNTGLAAAQERHASESTPSEQKAFVAQTMHSYVSACGSTGKQINPAKASAYLKGEDVHSKLIMGEITKYSGLYSAVSLLVTTISAQKHDLGMLESKKSGLVFKRSQILKAQDCCRDCEERILSTQEKAEQLQGASQKFGSNGEGTYRTLDLIQKYRELSARLCGIEARFAPTENEDKHRRRLEALELKQKRKPLVPSEIQDIFCARAFILEVEKIRETLNAEANQARDNLSAVAEELKSINPELGFVDLGRLSKIEADTLRLAEIAGKAETELPALVSETEQLQAKLREAEQRLRELIANI